MHAAQYCIHFILDWTNFRYFILCLMFMHYYYASYCVFQCKLMCFCRRRHSRFLFRFLRVFSFMRRMRDFFFKWIVNIEDIVSYALIELSLSLLSSARNGPNNNEMRWRWP